MAREGRVARCRWFLLLGFAATLALFFAVWLLPHLGLHPAVTLLVMAGLAALTARLARRMSGRWAWGAREPLALASGALGFFVLLAPLQELDRSRPDNTTGMAAVGLAAAVSLLLLARRASDSPAGDVTA